MNALKNAIISRKNSQMTIFRLIKEIRLNNKCERYLLNIAIIHHFRYISFKIISSMCFPKNVPIKQAHSKMINQIPNLQQFI